MGTQVMGEQVGLGKNIIVEEEQVSAACVSGEPVAGLARAGVLELQHDGAHGAGGSIGENFGDIGAGIGLGGIAAINADEHFELIARQRLAGEAFEAAGELVGPAAGGDEDADEHAPTIGDDAAQAAQVLESAQTASSAKAERPIVREPRVHVGKEHVMIRTSIEPSTMTTRPLSLKFAAADRRRNKRFPVARPGKAFRRATQQYAAVMSRNLSVGGALLEVQTARPIGVGELMDVAIAFRDRPVLQSESLVSAIVTRADPVSEGRQTVAVRYIEPVAMAA